MNSNTISASGAPLGRAKAAVIMLHGRGASAESMLSFADVFAQPDVAYLVICRAAAPNGSARCSLSSLGASPFNVTAIVVPRA
jgi:phospholipase/carboxylesterase